MQDSGNKSHSSSQSLSIRSKPDGFSFCFSTVKGYAYKELKMPTAFDFPERFEDFVQSRDWAGKDELEVTIIDFSDHFMLLPAKVSEEEHIKAFFNFQFQHDEAYQIFTVPLCDEKQLFCWEIPSSRDVYFEKMFPNLTILTNAYLLANWTIRQATFLNKPVLVAHLYGKIMHVFAADTENLLFANTFTIKDIQEIPYFVLRCLDQLSLDPLITKCIFCSESTNGQDVIDLISPYIKNIEMASFTHQTDEPLHITEKNQYPHANHQRNI